VGSTAFPAWLATAAMLLVAVMVPWVGGEQFWEAGYGPTLALFATVGLALSSRPLTLEVYGALVAVGLLVGVGVSLLDFESWTVVAVGGTVMIVTAYLVGDRPSRTAEGARDGGVEGGAPTSAISSEERLTPETLREIIAEAGLPIQEVHRGGGDIHVLAWRLVAVAKRRCILGEDAEQRVDAAVGEIGGKRVSVVDPWRVLPDLIRKLRGRSPLPAGDLYVIPGDVFQTARESTHTGRRRES